MHSGSPIGSERSDEDGVTHLDLFLHGAPASASCGEITKAPRSAMNYEARLTKCPSHPRFNSLID